MKKTMTAAAAIVECFEREGVTNVFCVPGESYLPVMDRIYESKKIRLISTRHEGGAAFMAEGYGKAKRKPGIAMATRGVGGANLAIGIHTAYQDSTPMIVLLGQVHSKFRGREGFQEVDLDQFFGHIAKWTVELKDAERVPEIMQRAFRVAQSGRPGPVVISLPEDVLVEEAEMYFGPVVNLPAPRPGINEINQVEEILKDAKRPLILAGGGVIACNGEQELIQVAERFRIPVMAAFRRQDVFPNNHPLYAGHSGLGARSSILDTIRQADVVLAVGTRLSEVTTQDYSIFNHHPKLIHIDIDYDTIGKVFTPDAGILADAKEALNALMDMNVDGDWKEWSKERRSVFEKSNDQIPKEDENWISNRNVIRVLQEKLPKDAIITNDAGNFASWLHDLYSFDHPKSYIGPTSGAMGYGLPSAIGAKVASPNRTVVSLSGDGGFMMTVQELETAARYGIPVISLVFNNNSFGTIRMHQEKHYPERVIGTALGKVNFTQLAEALGVQGIKVQTDEEFEQAFEKALLSNTSVVIEIISNVERISVNDTIQSIRNKTLQQNGAFR
ncbi:thiamine pyrophosphate-dependent enzyme [Neobacillus niacini]|uniref:thiamine pyrophosphate-dependent enzyme n=1 Tax=Neobacillus niacini TaxID=86668 RepID=UPI00285E8A8E|nr:thiamine pyrophosphate-dependent enzyme [Neobacillus niacini]MDR6998493.1 acetolactate synthase-1/2/3 large subunit [Neobacillus niacini]